ncbi:MAG: phosphatidate cytidylyltransferase [Lachnospiraceae bacterium]|nr:phosphatidate cytidylyltransferase [Lachnospiraceae bacterium]
MFKTRLLSGIVLMAVIIFFMVYGSYPLFVFITAISLIGLFELYRTVKMEKSVPAILCYITSIALDIFILDGYYYMAAIAGIAVFLLVMACYVFGFPKYKSDQISMLLFGLMYVTVCLSCVFKVRFMQNGIVNVWLIFICAWGSDTCAYCVGRLIGKTHLPGNLHELSPKKTVAGCVGGVVGAALIGGIYAAIMYKDKNMIWVFIFICAVGAVIGQIGDLAASAIKRNNNIKDYSNLIPGHGGILDRFDSIIFTAPIVFTLLLLTYGKYHTLFMCLDI